MKMENKEPKVENENYQNCKKLADEIKKTDFKDIVSQIQSILKRIPDLSKNHQRNF